MRMASAEHRAIGKALENLRRERGLNQEELARRLAVSQPHISRVLSGKILAGNKLRLRIEKLLAAERQSEVPGKWLAKVGAAAGRSEDFRRLVNLAMDMLEKKM
jgi:transcriptional regulator with XRE-family HTH domain